MEEFSWRIGAWHYIASVPEGFMDKVVPLFHRRREKAPTQQSQRKVTASCWHRMYDLIQEIPEEDIREEAMEFWRGQLPKILLEL
jgi:hypothetical protein